MNDLPILFSAEAIALRVAALARAVAGALPEDFVIVALLKGAFVLAADLARALDREGRTPEIEFLRASSYGHGQTSRGEVAFAAAPLAHLAGRAVLLVDDVQDTGRTLQAAAERCRAAGAARVWSLALLDKPSRRAVAFEADFVGFTIPDVFVVGYGIDWGERYRHLPFIAHVGAQVGPAEPAADTQEP